MGIYNFKLLCRLMGVRITDFNFYSHGARCLR